MFNVGIQEVAIVLVIALIVFGPKRLPEVGRSFGRGLREFRRASNEFMASITDEDDARRKLDDPEREEGDA